MLMSTKQRKENEYVCVQNRLGAGNGSRFDLANIIVEISCSDVWDEASYLKTVVSMMVVTIGI